jgi:hypothetical protein
MTYTIIQAVTNSYDKIFDCNDLNATERLLFTDNKTNVKNWNIQYIKPAKDYPFDDIFSIRWNPFKYTNTDYVIWLDGSIKINGSVKKYIDEMIKTNSDFGVLKHPFRNNIFDEYREWCKIRNYNQTMAFKWLNYITENGWNPKNIGLYQVNVCIFKNTERIKQFCLDACKELHVMDNKHFERLDQPIITYLLKTKYKDLNILELSEKMYKNSKELKWVYKHPKR